MVSLRDTFLINRKEASSALALEISGFFRRMELRCRSTRTRYSQSNCYDNLYLQMTGCSKRSDWIWQNCRVSSNPCQSTEVLIGLPHFSNELGNIFANIQLTFPNIFNPRYNLHIIYLARDPRGILNSVRALPSQWPARLLSPLHICSRYSPTPDLYTDMWFLRAMFSKGYSTTPSTYPLTISPRFVRKNSFEIDQIKNGAVVTMISTDNDPQIWRLGESAFWRTCSDRGKVQHLPDQ